MKRIDYDNPDNDHDVTLFKFYSSFARILHDLISNDRKSEACELLMAAIDYSTAIENEEEFKASFSDLTLEYVWKSIRPNIGKTANDLARWRRAQEAKKNQKEVAHDFSEVNHAKTVSAHEKREVNHAKTEQRLLEEKDEDRRKKKQVTEEKGAAPINIDQSVCVDRNITEKEIIDFYIECGLQSKYVTAELDMTAFAIKNISAYMEAHGPITESNFEDYKQYALRCFNKAKKKSGLV